MLITVHCNLFAIETNDQRNLYNTNKMNSSLDTSLDQLRSSVVNAIVGLIVTVIGAFAAALLANIRQAAAQAEAFATVNVEKLNELKKQTSVMLASSSSGTQRANSSTPNSEPTKEVKEVKTE
jgi:hypothetical protein